MIRESYTNQIGSGMRLRDDGRHVTELCESLDSLLTWALGLAKLSGVGAYVEIACD